MCVNAKLIGRFFSVAAGDVAVDSGTYSFGLACVEGEVRGKS
jgi:hypothetical protein